MDAVVATNNKHKLEEIKLYLKDRFDNIYSLKECGINIEIEENGTTFLENAKIKASTIAKMTKKVAIADDSGLCVDALNGDPGVYSARFAGEPCNDENNNQKLLKVLADKHIDDYNARSAHYTSVVVIYYPDDKFIFGEGKVEGHILKEYVGNGGFGYDPLFYCDEIKKTFAQITMEEKNKVSHRARALEDVLKKLWKTSL